jgi:hypothetical protein
MTAPHQSTSTNGSESSNAMVRSVSIENLLNQRDAVRVRLGQAIALLQEASGIARGARLGVCDVEVALGGRKQDRIRIVGGYKEDAQQEILAVWMKAIDAGAWGYLMNESGLRSFMDAQARKKWDEAVHEHDVPELTQANIEATFETLHASRGDMFERGVLEVFRRLAWDYKTNTPFKFGKKIILNYLIDSYGKGPGKSYRSNTSTTDELDDLDRVMHILDGKPEPDVRNGWAARMNASGLGNFAGAKGAYFSLQWYRKGTGHVVFDRMDLVEKMNQILTKHYPNALADATQKRTGA